MDVRARYAALASLPAALDHTAKSKGDAPALWAKRDGEWRAIRYSDFRDRAWRLAARLRAAGVQPGDRVLLASENRPEWGIADAAIMAAGAVTVPAYATNMPDDHRHVLMDSGAKAAFISNPALGERFLPAYDDADQCSFVISFDAVDGVETLEDAIAKSGDEDIDASVAALKRDDLACFIYTSGTGGAPKGVMTRHGAILTNAYGAHDLIETFGPVGDEVFLCFLPLSHAYEHTCGLWFPVTIGAQIYYAESVEKLVANMVDARPTVMTAVPRLYESMRDKIQRGLTKQPKLKQKMFAAALKLGAKRYKAPEQMTFADKAQDFVLDKLVRAKVAERFGGRLKGFVSGGGRLDPDVGLFFNALGVTCLQGYGQTETGPVVCCNRPESLKIETVGPIFPDVDVKFDSDGEILVRGELVMQGYWNLPETTAAAFTEDGWLRTGDIGAFDDQNRLMITDRKKDILVLSGGDNVSPARIEGKLTLRTEIAQAIALGDGKSHVGALIVLDDQWKREAGFNDRTGDDADLRSAISAAIDAVNKDLAVIEKVKRFAILDEPCTIENGLMTPTLKVRRHLIRERYGDRIAALF